MNNVSGSIADRRVHSHLKVFTETHQTDDSVSFLLSCHPFCSSRFDLNCVCVSSPSGENGNCVIQLRSCGKVLSNMEKLCGSFPSRCAPDEHQNKQHFVLFFPISVYWDEKILADPAHSVVFRVFFFRFTGQNRQKCSDRSQNKVFLYFLGGQRSA